MNKTVSGVENLYFEMGSVRNETEARIYDDVASESATSATEQTSSKKCSNGADKKQNTSSEHENGCQCNTVVLRRLLLLMSVVAAVALLTATAALILVLTAMKAEVQGKQSREYFVAKGDLLMQEREKSLKNLLYIVTA